MKEITPIKIEDACEYQGQEVTLTGITLGQGTLANTEPQVVKCRLRKSEIDGGILFVSVAIAGSLKRLQQGADFQEIYPGEDFSSLKGGFPNSSLASNPTRIAASSDKLSF